MAEDFKSLELGKIHRVRTVLKALKKYTADNIQITELDSCLGLSKACALEVKYIAELDTFKHGWNETIGGEGQPSYTPDSKTRNKISVANSGKVRTAEMVEANRDRSRIRSGLDDFNKTTPKVTKPCVIDGNKFSSILEAKQFYGVDHYAIQKMIVVGVSTPNIDSQVTVYGIVYKNKAELYKSLGWSKQNYYNYLMFGSPYKPKGVSQYVVDGKSYSSLQEIAKEFGCSLTGAMYKASGGVTTKDSSPKQVTLFGKSYNSKKDACDDLVISKSTLELLLLGKEANRTYAKYRYNDLYFSSEASFKRLTNLSSWYFREYLKSGAIVDLSNQYIKYDIETGKAL